MYLVKRGHFLSRDKDGGHSIRSAISEYPMIVTYAIRIFYRTDVIADRRFTLPKYRIPRFFCACDFDLDPRTFIYELYQHPSRCTRRPEMNFPRQGFRKLLYFIHIHTYSLIQTDRRHRNYQHAASRVVIMLYEDVALFQQ